MRYRSRGGAAAAAAIAVVVLTSLLYGCHRSPAFDRRPDQNVLLVTIDTLRGDALGCYGGPSRTRTPC